MRLASIFLVIALSGAVASCSEFRNGTGAISQKLGEAVHAPGATEVDLGKLTSFGWEYFYAFKPGTTREEVCKIIKAGRNVCGRIIRIEKAPEGYTFLIFGLNGQLTHVELHALENGRFDMSFAESGHPRSKSIFRIRRNSTGSGKDVIFLEPK